MRLAIVGGGPAALSAARAYRAADGEGDVTMITPETALPYNRPPLSKDFLRGETEEDELAIEPPSFYSEQEITVLTDLVTAIEPGQLRLRDDTLRYDQCILATGSRPTAQPGLRSLADGRGLRRRAEQATRATVVGSGFIGCEAAASLAMRGLDVTLVSMEDIPHETRLGPEVGRRIAQWLEEYGVELKLGQPLDERPDGLLLMATGVEQGGLIGDGRVTVDAQMRTEHPHLLAAGDVAYAHNASAGRHLAVEHWGEALNMGEIAGKTAAGVEASWDVAPGFWSTIGERTLKYVAWGDGYDEVRIADHPLGWTAWYGRDGVTVGVLTHNTDADYERGRTLVETGAPLP